MSKKTEIISKSKESILVNFYSSLSKQIREDSPVLSKQAMNVPDKIVGIAVKFVVIIIPALIRTEFFIGAAL